MSPALLYVLAGFAVGVFSGTFKPFLGFKKAPPTAELSAAQAQLAQAQAAAESARRDADNAGKLERVKLEAQIHSTQEDAAGVVTALGHAPQGPEVKLAAGMAQRVEYKLALAIGGLPQADREAIVRLVEDALNGKQAEFDREMARRDAEFAALAKERDSIKAQLPVLASRAAEAEEAAKAKQGAVTSLTNEVSAWAAKTHAKEAEAGSLSGALERVWFWAKVIAAAWAFLAFGLPGLVKHMATGPVKNGLRNLSGYLLNPLVYHDARVKLAASVNTTTTINPPTT